MQRRLTYIILFLFSASGHYILYTTEFSHSGSNSPLLKFKIPGEVNLLGEDAFSTDEDGMIVCDGVGGYSFTSYFAAKLFSLAAKHFYIKQRALRMSMGQSEELWKDLLPSTKESTVEQKAISVVAGLEYGLKTHIAAANLVLGDYLSARSSKDQKVYNEEYFVQMFSELVKFGLPEKYFGPDFPLHAVSKAAREVLEAGATITSASLLPMSENADPVLLFYKAGTL